MPIKVICSECGGRGYRLFLKSKAADDFERVMCSGCKGSGCVEELTWEERREKESQAQETK